MFGNKLLRMQDKSWALGKVWYFKHEVLYEPMSCPIFFVLSRLETFRISFPNLTYTQNLIDSYFVQSMSNPGAPLANFVMATLSSLSWPLFRLGSK